MSVSPKLADAAERAQKVRKTSGCPYCDFGFVRERLDGDIWVHPLKRWGAKEPELKVCLREKEAL